MPKSQKTGACGGLNKAERIFETRLGRWWQFSVQRSLHCMVFVVCFLSSKDLSGRLFEAARRRPGRCRGGDGARTRARGACAVGAAERVGGRLPLVAGRWVRPLAAPPSPSPVVFAPQYTRRSCASKRRCLSLRRDTLNSDARCAGPCGGDRRPRRSRGVPSCARGGDSPRASGAERLACKRATRLMVRAFERQRRQTSLSSPRLARVSLRCACTLRGCLVHPARYSRRRAARARVPDVRAAPEHGTLHSQSAHAHAHAHAHCGRRRW